jgi:hypothetical protein
MKVLEEEAVQVAGFTSRRRRDLIHHRPKSVIAPQ